MRSGNFCWAPDRDDISPQSLAFMKHFAIQGPVLRFVLFISLHPHYLPRNIRIDQWDIRSVCLRDVGSISDIRSNGRKSSIPVLLISITVLQHVGE